jgi:hypothetical protein
VKTILLKLKGPMQSWGTSSHFETRNTDYYPSKSAVIGIIAASFGYRRDQEQKIKELNELDFALRVDQPGTLLRDYHIAQKYKKTGEFERTYVTNRYYMEDAVFVAAISHANDQQVEEIYEALQHPYFSPFMGRRSCPVPLDFIIKITEEDAITALEKLEWQAAEWYKKKYADYRAEIYADKALLPQGIATMRKDYVISFSQKERKFGPRFEVRKSINLSGSDGRCKNNDLDFYGSI